MAGARVKDYVRHVRQELAVHISHAYILELKQIPLRPRVRCLLHARFAARAC